MNTKIKTIAAIACGVVACGLSQSAHANLVTNPGFESTTGGSTGQIGYNGFGVTGWTASGIGANNNYDFIFGGNSADSAGAKGVDGTITLWGPANGSANGLKASPDGGNFLGIDPVYTPNGGTVANSVSQTLTGLTKGATYTVSFYWAAAQQSGFSGSGNPPTTTEQWDVSFGGSTQDTSVYTLSNHGFSGWMQQSFTFTADGTSDTLKFLAAGGPTSSQPPFDLLDGVSVTQNVPDSSSTAGLMGLGVAAMGIAAGCRRFCRA